MACAVWNAGLTQQEVRGLERVQKTALAVIRGENHTSYSDALNHFGLETLETRREKLCLKFALKAYRNTKFTSWFVTNKPEVNTRTVKTHLKQINTRTKRFEKSPIPYLTKLLNTHFATGCQKK